MNDVPVPAFYVKTDLTDRNGSLIVYLTDSITLTGCRIRTPLCDPGNGHQK